MADTYQYCSPTDVKNVLDINEETDSSKVGDPIYKKYIGDAMSYVDAKLKRFFATPFTSAQVTANPIISTVTQNLAAAMLFKNLFSHNRRAIDEVDVGKQRVDYAKKEVEELANNPTMIDIVTKPMILAESGYSDDFNTD